MSIYSCIRKLVIPVADFLGKHSNLIFGAIEVIGLSATACTAVVATKNANIVLEEHKDENLTTKEKIKLVAPEYIWCALALVGTATVIVGSNIYDSKKKAALTSAVIIARDQLATTRDVFRDYRKETAKYLPQDEKEQKRIESIISKRKSDETPSESMFKKYGGDILHVKEVDTGIEYDCRFIELDDAINQANRVINEEGFCPVNTFHEFLPNAPISEIGWDIGWDGARDGLISYREPDLRLEEGPNNGERVVICYIEFNKVPRPKP